MSATPWAMARFCAPVRAKGSSFSKPLGYSLGMGWGFFVLRPFLMPMSPSCSSKNSSKISRRRAVSSPSADWGKWMCSNAKLRWHSWYCSRSRWGRGSFTVSGSSFRAFCMAAEIIREVSPWVAG